MTSAKSKKNARSSYLFGFNTQEKVDEIAGKGNHNTALFWEYDTRLGRRWNLDPKVKEYESPYACLGNNPIWFTDVNGDDSVVYNQKGKEIDRVKVADITHTYYDQYGEEVSERIKVPDVFFVEYADGDTKVNGRNTYQALSRESIFGDPDEEDAGNHKGSSKDIFTTLDKDKVSTVKKAQDLVNSKMYWGSNWADFFLNANSRKDNDFKRTALGTGIKDDDNYNTSYLVQRGNKKVIMNRNEAGNYLFGMACRQKGIPLVLVLTSGHVIEMIHFKAMLDEPNEQEALKLGHDNGYSHQTLSY